MTSPVRPPKTTTTTTTTDPRLVGCSLAGPRWPRRSLLQGLGAAAVFGPHLASLSWSLSSTPARAAGTGARRVVFFYFPDGVPGRSQDGDPSAWTTTSPSTLSRCHEPLGARAADVVFVNGVSSGPTDAGSHPGGAKKLFTAVDGGQGPSLDQVLARGRFASSPWQHLYLGAMANQNNASGDKHITYPAAGTTLAPEDNPRVAFARLFAGGGVVSSAGAATPTGLPTKRRSILDVVKRDLDEIRGRVDAGTRARIDLHAAGVREVESRLAALPTSPSTPTTPTTGCSDPALAYSVDDAALYDAARFPEILRAQVDVAVLALACGLTRVVTIQASHHTSELIMSRFPGTELFDPTFDMRSHQASHYGTRHDDARVEYRRYVQQRRFFVGEFARLLDELRARPDPEVPGATLLDTSLVVVGSEVGDGNTHSHDDLPFLLAGRAGGALGTGRALNLGFERHHKLLASVARLCGAEIDGFGDGHGTLSGL
jgi:hypothetical protein